MSSAICLWDLVPIEIGLSIFERLSFRDQVNLAFTCKRLYEISCDRSLARLQMHRFIACFANKVVLPGRIAQSVRILNLPLVIRPSTLQFFAQQLAQIKKLTELTCILPTVSRREQEEELGVLEDALKQMSDLQSLNLRWYGSDVEFLVRAFERFAKLTKLQLRMSEKGLELLTKVSTQLKDLTHFAVSGVSIGKLDRAKILAQALDQMRRLTNLKLEFYPQSESIRILTEALSGIKTLEVLDFSGSQLEELEKEELKILGSTLAQLPHLQVLNLSSCISHRRQIEAILKRFSDTCNLTTLDLSNNIMEEVRLGHALTKMRKLTQLDLSECHMGPYSAGSLADGLRELSNLKRLHLDNTNFDRDSIIEALSELTLLEDLSIDLETSAAVFARSLVLLTRLKILHVRFTRLVMKKMKKVEALAEAFTLMKNLRELHLEKYTPVACEGGGLVRLAQSLSQLKGLRAFTLKESGVSDAGIAVLAQALSLMDYLESLSLSGNQFGVEGAKDLAKALISMRELKNLDLSVNRIGNKGAEAIAEAISGMHYLEDLNLKYCKLQAEGVEALAHALMAKNHLKSLNFAGNKMGDRGAQALAKALTLKVDLQKIDLTFCEIKDIGVEALAKAVASALYLETMSLSHNDFGEKGAQALKKIANPMLYISLIVNSTFSSQIHNY